MMENKLQPKIAGILMDEGRKQGRAEGGMHGLTNAVCM
jgi:hypothetical protein